MSMLIIKTALGQANYDAHDFVIFSIDLSFNNIECIEGLEKLTKLKDLTLYNNRISILENMESLVDLHVFSAGNNRLEQLENVSYCHPVVVILKSS